MSISNAAGLFFKSGYGGKFHMALFSFVLPLFDNTIFFLFPVVQHHVSVLKSTCRVE